MNLTLVSTGFSCLGGGGLPFYSLSINSLIPGSFYKKFIDKALYNNYSVGYLVSLYDILLNNQQQIREKTPIGI
jgi:hypothetical protein